MGNVKKAENNTKDKKKKSVKISFRKLSKNPFLFIFSSVMKVLPEHYDSCFIMRKHPMCNGMLHIDLWRFKSMKSGKVYLVDVEIYEKHIYGIKFYLKSQAHLKNRYKFLTNDFEPLL